MCSICIQTKESGLPTLTVLPWVSQFQCKSHGLAATQANLTGSPLRCVSIQKWYSNGASDADFLPQQMKNAAWCWKRSLNFAYCGRGLHFHDAKPCIHKLCKRHRLVLMRFMTRNCWFSCSGCGLQATSVGTTPTREPSLKVFGVPWLTGLGNTWPSAIF